MSAHERDESESLQDELKDQVGKARREKVVLDTAAETMVEHFITLWAPKKKSLPFKKQAVGIIDGHAASTSPSTGLSHGL